MRTPASPSAAVLPGSRRGYGEGDGCRDILNFIYVIFSFDQFWGKFSVSLGGNSRRLEAAHLAAACRSGHVGAWSLAAAQCLWVKKEPVIGLPLPGVPAGTWWAQSHG